MRQHLDTIPIWDAYKSDCECPLCAIEQHNEAMYVDNFLGGSVMEPAVRIEVNEKGFCKDHFQQLYDMKNRLGLALMAHTYLKTSMAKIEGQQFEKKSLFGKKDKVAVSPAEEVATGCIICERLEATMYRYALTMCYMWKKEPEFRQALKASKGFCLPHYALMLKAAEEELGGSDFTAMRDELRAVEMENLRRMEKDIEWFTLKFDYRNQDKPWGTSQDAVERTLNKLRGRAIHSS